MNYYPHRARIQWRDFKKHNPLPTPCEHCGTGRVDTVAGQTTRTVAEFKNIGRRLWGVEVWSDDPDMSFKLLKKHARYKNPLRLGDVPVNRVVPFLIRFSPHKMRCEGRAYPVRVRETP